MVQLQDRPGNADGNQPVDHRKHHPHQTHQQKNEITHIDHAVSEGGIGNHPHQLPSGITDRIDNNLPAFPLKFLIIDPSLIGCCFYTVFTGDPVADLYLPRMVNDLSIAVTDIKILPVVKGVDLFHHPGNTRIIHIYQEHAQLGHAILCDLNHTAQRDHPVITHRGIVEQILNMWCGKMHIFHLFHRLLVPALSGHIRILFLRRHRLRRQQASIIVINGNTAEIILVRLIQKIHLRLYILLLTGKITFLYHVVVHCI